jgi:hypothetical protein
MRSVFVILALAALGSSASAQSKAKPCDFLKNLKFRNGRDTIVVKAILCSDIEAPPRLLNKHPSIYKYKFDSYIEFQPENCSKKYNEPLLSSAAAKARFLNGNNLGITIYLTCIIFDEHTIRKDVPDCLVIRVFRTMPGVFK